MKVLVAVILSGLVAVSCSKKTVALDDLVLYNQPPHTQALITGAPDTSPYTEIETPPESEKEMFSHLRFNLNSYSLQNSVIADLNHLAKYLQKTPNIRVLLKGYTCPLGTDDFNLALSVHRAEACAKYLMNAGIIEDRISTIGYGEEGLIIEYGTAEELSPNRRVEIEIQ